MIGKERPTRTTVSMAGITQRRQQVACECFSGIVQISGRNCRKAATACCSLQQLRIERIRYWAYPCFQDRNRRTLRPPLYKTQGGKVGHRAQIQLPRRPVLQILLRLAGGCKRDAIRRYPLGRRTAALNRRERHRCDHRRRDHRGFRGDDANRSTVERSKRCGYLVVTTRPVRNMTQRNRRKTVEIRPPQ